jgi:hypothetical protein
MWGAPTSAAINRCPLLFHATDICRLPLMWEAPTKLIGLLQLTAASNSNISRIYTVYNHYGMHKLQGVAS